MTDKTSYIHSLPIPEGSKRPVKDNLEMMAFTDPRRPRPFSLAFLDYEVPAPQDGRKTGDMSVYWYYTKTLGVWRSLIFVLLISGYVVGVTFPCMYTGNAFCFKCYHANLISHLGQLVDKCKLDKTER